MLTPPIAVWEHKCMSEIGSFFTDNRMHVSDLNKDTTWGGWVVQLVECPALVFGSDHDITVMGWSPTSGSMLSVDSC